MASLKKNFIYQTGYQVLATALPLITTPYINRVLGAEQLGTYTYAANIANYFTIFAMRGFNNYGSKMIAATKHNENKLAHKKITVFDGNGSGCHLFIIRKLVYS